MNDNMAANPNMAMQANTEPSIMETAFHAVDRAISDLIDEIIAVEHMITPILSPEDTEMSVTPAGDRQPMSVVARETFNIADRLQWQTQRLNALKRRVEL